MENLLVQIRRDGIIRFAGKASRFILRKSMDLDWRWEIIAERSLEEPIEEIEPRIKVTIRQATENDLDKFKGIVSESKLELFKERFEKGRICFIALDGEKAVSFAWISFENEYEGSSQVEVKLNAGEGYLFDDYTLPEYRHNRLQTALIAKRLAYLKDKAYRKASVLLWDKATYSRKAYRAVGFGKGKKVMLVTLFGVKFHRWRKFEGCL